MQSSRYSIYMAYSLSMCRLGFARDIELELACLNTCHGYDTIVQMSYPLCLSLAEFILIRVSTRQERLGRDTPARTRIKNLFGRQRVLHTLINQKFRSVKKHLHRIGCDTSWNMRELKISHILPCELPRADSIECVRQILKGRILFESEIESIVRSHTSLPFSRGILDILVLDGYGKRYPGVSITEFFGSRCNRCGETSKILEVDCSFCGERDQICKSCVSMGISTGCRALYAFPDDEVSHGADCKKVKAQLGFTLTSVQKRASEYMLEFLRSTQSNECLIWAVCGAGKTEVAFAAIEDVLSRGGNILFAVPRRNVVIELEPRLREAFPDVDITALYGGAPERFSKRGITIATTHQVMRFSSAFDLVILDEADAYPYAGSSMLYMGTQRARKPSSKFVYMTATPHGSLHRTSGFVIRIPARHHGYPVPVPEILKARSRTTCSIPKSVISFLYESVFSKYQVFFFVPTIDICEQVGKALLAYFSTLPGRSLGISVAYSHSQDSLRDKKCEEFVSGKTDVFITTSIMERGITVPAANVVVMFADNERIYDHGSLIQMAGRSGRTTQYPTGRVLFVAEKCTPAMRQAINTIVDMNNEALRLGYLREGGF
jgi:competence protein ComFA